MCIIKRLGILKKKKKYPAPSAHTQKILSHPQPDAWRHRRIPNYTFDKSIEFRVSPSILNGFLFFSAALFFLFNFFDHFWNEKKRHKSAVVRDKQTIGREREREGHRWPRNELFLILSLSLSLSLSQSFPCCPFYIITIFFFFFLFVFLPIRNRIFSFLYRVSKERSIFVDVRSTWKWLFSYVFLRKCNEQKFRCRSRLAPLIFLNQNEIIAACRFVLKGLELAWHIFPTGTRPVGGANKNKDKQNYLKTSKKNKTKKKLLPFCD